jgi:hypothetical protein
MERTVDPNRSRENMKRSPQLSMWRSMLVGLCSLLFLPGARAVEAAITREFPPPLAHYADSHLVSLWQVLWDRIVGEPLNLAVSVLFLAAPGWGGMIIAAGKTTSTSASKWSSRTNPLAWSPIVLP